MLAATACLRLVWCVYTASRLSGTAALTCPAGHLEGLTGQAVASVVPGHHRQQQQLP
jgi:hypothetical protein